MVPTLTQPPARRLRVVAVVGVLMLVLAAVAVGALASRDGGSAVTGTRPTSPVENVPPAETRTAPAPLESGPTVASPADPTPTPVYEEWQINEMNARHPEP
jgi:hypothetical protein